MKNLGMIMLGVWLVAQGLADLVKLSFPGEKTVLAVLALAAGVALLIAAVANRTAEMGSLVLGIWLILTGVMPLFGIGFAYSHYVMAGLAILAGVFVIMKR